MRFISLLPVFVASTLGSALPDIEERALHHLADGEVHVLKRDAIITPRDIELAARDNVDPNQMYRHSIIKRDDGDHITIWVANSYNEFEEENSGTDDLDADGLDADDSVADDSDVELTKRKYRVGKVSWGTSGKNRNCYRTSYIGDTGPHAPFTGGANAIMDWGHSNCKGGWGLMQKRNDLIVAGSNSGYNIRFTTEMTMSLGFGVAGNFGCHDVGLITRTSRDRFQQNHGGWRVRARGETSCDVVGTACYKTQCQPSFGSRPVKWWLDNYTGKI